MRLLLVEDEERLGIQLRANLARAAFASDVAGTIEDARALLATTTYDAMLLDLVLPDGSGLELLRELRLVGSDLPVIAVTARDAVSDRVKGLDAGADDYLVKPFAMDELLARVRALLRRPGAVLGKRLACGNTIFDTLTRSLFVADRPVSLARRELALLEALLRASGRVVTRETLLDQIYDDRDGSPVNALPVHIHALRRALEKSGSSIEIITFRGLGYMLRDPGGGTP